MSRKVLLRLMACFVWVLASFPHLLTLALQHGHHNVSVQTDAGKLKLVYHHHDQDTHHEHHNFLDRDFDSSSSEHDQEHNSSIPLDHEASLSNLQVVFRTHDSTVLSKLIPVTIFQIIQTKSWQLSDCVQNYSPPVDRQIDFDPLDLKSLSSIVLTI